MALQGIEKKHEIQRSRLMRDTRSMYVQVREMLSSFPALIGAYFIFVGVVVFLPGTFELVLICALGYFFIPFGRKPDIPLRKRESLGEIDHNDLDPKYRKPQKGRGIAFLANRTSDNAEVWADADLLKTHVFVIGSTGAGKTEMLLSLAYNALVWCSGFSYVDGKGDVSLWTKVASMVKACTREDDLLVINYMTGNADTTKRRTDKLSNTYNPQMVGNSESNIQLLVSLMDSGDGKGDMWKGRAISFISSYMPALVELRDAGHIMLYVGLIREYMPFVKYLELMANPNISDRSRSLMQAYLMDVPGYKRDKGENQSSTFLDQYGYQQMQFTRILSSLADTYGHIYNTPQGEINLKDVVTNRRILLVLLPALEKSRPELSNLGKIILAGFKGMMGANLGSKLEGSKQELLDKRATTAPSPFVSIYDELGYYMPPEDTALMYAQARSLGFSLVAAGQDLQAFYRTSKEETLAIVSNSNIKIYGKLEDPTDTYDLITKLAGEAYVSVVDGYEIVDGAMSVGGYRSGDGAKIERVARIELQDLQRQIEGEVHIMVKSEIIRARVFYAAPKIAQEFRLNHFIRVPMPDQARLKAMAVNTRELMEALQLHALGKQRPGDGYFSYAAEALETEQFKQYEQADLGIERGIYLLAHYDDSRALPVTTGTQEGTAGGSGGASLAAGPAAAPAATLAPAASVPQAALASAAPYDEARSADVVFDGAQLESVNMFGAVVAADVPGEIQAFGQAALPIAAIALELDRDLVVWDDCPTGSAEGSRAAETEASLNRIALGLGASSDDASMTAASVISAAQEGTQYPVPPKPAADGKAELMSSVLADLESLMQG